jgi:hypothetical protein
MKMKQRQQEYDRIIGILEKAPRVTFGILTEAQNRTDLLLMGQCVDRLTNLVEVRAKVVDTFVPEANGSVPEDVPVEPTAEVG